MKTAQMTPGRTIDAMIADAVAEPVRAEIAFCADTLQDADIIPQDLLDRIASNNAALLQMEAGAEKINLADYGLWV